MNVRVLYWTQLFWPYVGGIEVLGTEFLPRMQARGYEFAVVTSHGSLDLPDEASYGGIPIYRFPFQTALSGRDVQQILDTQARLARLKQAFRPDLVHLSFTDPSVFFHWRTASAHPAPTLVAIRLALPSRPADADSLTGQTLRSANWITTNSQAMLDDVAQIVPEAAARASVIYNALRMPALDPTPLPFSPPTLLCLGRVVEDKGFDLAIRALVEIRNAFPRVRLQIAGDGPARPALEQLAQDLGVAGAVDFLGWIAPESVPRLMNAATLVIMPSRWREAFGLVALQAGQMGRPVVATRVGGLPEVVAHGESGLVVDPENSQALAGAILALLEDPARAVDLGRKGRDRAQRVFGWDQYLDAHDRLYRELIGGQHEWAESSPTIDLTSTRPKWRPR